MLVGEAINDSTRRKGVFLNQMSQEIYLKQLELGPMQNYVYLLGDPESHKAVVIDPGWEPAQILSEIESDGYDLVGAIATHHHFDHVTGLKPLLKAVGMPIYVHSADAQQLDIASDALTPTKDGYEIKVGKLSLRCLHTPGHTPGSQCLLVDGRLFTGDTLFINACGRWDLPGGDVAKLYDSLNNILKALPEDTVVYPGHNYAPSPTSTIKQEKRSNPFFQPKTLEEFLKLAGGS